MKRFGCVITFGILLIFSNLASATENEGVIPWLAQNSWGVRHVIDGDTFIAHNQKHIRLLGINTPELKKEKKKAEAYADEARKILKGLIFKKSVTLIFDENQQDQYKRLLAYVYLKDGRFINEILIEKGAGYVLYKKPNTKHFERLLESQRSAMKAKTGIWKLLQSNVKTPYRGNLRSKRFHLVTCRSGKKTHKKNQRTFKGHWDAFYEGFAPAKCCLDHMNKFYLYPSN